MQRWSNWCGQSPCDENRNADRATARGLCLERYRAELRMTANRKAVWGSEFPLMAVQRPILGPELAAERDEPGTVGIRQIPSCRSITPASGHSNPVIVRWRLFGVPNAAMNSAVPLAPEEP
jgi:hypothetical protein